MIIKLITFGLRNTKNSIAVKCLQCWLTPVQHSLSAIKLLSLRRFDIVSENYNSYLQAGARRKQHDPIVYHESAGGKGKG